ncbi:hypothetical protein HMPREF1624_08790 [Sporothrix schenckii ATCC 58251]|uniref:Maintenance of telomere capping protein 1 n=1 Tax=Sporothrix schenckii (strain ATCC 58251 / de Perez 2211183) TaxID=1391915 RepID=U7PHB5_SPOS1|nr:hypothetical protein HMPREF1624_08790 [Sporothrix schenckii ATCC 58251]
MASKRAKSATNEELDSLFEGIGDEKPTGAAKKAGKAKTTGTGKLKSAADKDLLAALENEVGDEIVRPHTPRISKEAKASPASASASASAPAPARRSVESSKAYSARTSTDERAVDASAEGAAAPPAATTATATATSTVAAPASGGWWGGILSTASAAMKQAEAAVKEIQQNEEAKKWADQVRGNVVSLRGFGDELRHRALPTFTNILHTLAPPIASHERLLIHITHDMVGYPALDPLVHGVFTRVMAQVEGGDLLVIQRGQESQAAGSASVGSGGSGGHSRNSAGWRDGPWWRVVHYPRDLGAVPGLREGTKLCRASAEAYANEYYAAHYGSDDKDKGTSKGGARDRVADSKRGLAVARQRAVEPVSEQNPVRRSDIFLAVQAFTVAAEPKDEDEDDDDDEDDDEDDEDEATDASDESDELVQFAVHIRDPVHDIVYHTVSQALPAKWVRWLDARPSTSASALTPATSGGEGEGEEEEDDDDSSDDDDSRDADGASAKQAKASAYDAGVPDEIREIIDSGAVDPREWVAEWIEETLTLAVGVVAQRYVARRMGVGAGSIGRGKRPVDEILADNAGEAARAGII